MTFFRCDVSVIRRQGTEWSHFIFDMPRDRPYHTRQSRAGSLQMFHKVLFNTCLLEGTSCLYGKLLFLSYFFKDAHIHNKSVLLAKTIKLPRRDSLEMPLSIQEYAHRLQTEYKARGGRTPAYPCSNHFHFDPHPNERRWFFRKSDFPEWEVHAVYPSRKALPWKHG